MRNLWFQVYRAKAQIFQKRNLLGKRQSASLCVVFPQYKLILKTISILFNTAFLPCALWKVSQPRYTLLILMVRDAFTLPCNQITSKSLLPFSRSVEQNINILQSWKDFFFFPQVTSGNDWRSFLGQQFMCAFLGLLLRKSILPNQVVSTW